MWDNNITRCPGRFESVGDRMPAWESACRLMVCGPQWPTVEQPQPRWRRSAAVVTRRTLGQNNSLSPSSTHLSHTTNITLSRIKCERYIFIKKCLRSFIEIRILCLIMFRIYLYTRSILYNNSTFLLGETWPQVRNKQQSFRKKLAMSPAATPMVCHWPPDCTRESPHS